MKCTQPTAQRHARVTWRAARPGRWGQSGGARAAGCRGGAHLQRWFAAFPLPLRPSHLHRGATGTSRMPKYGSSTLKTHYSTLLFQNQLLLLTSLFPLPMEAESNLVRSSCLCRPLEGNPVNSLVLSYGRIKGFPNFENAFQTPEKGYLPSFQSKHKIIGLFNESFFFYVYYI